MIRVRQVKVKIEDNSLENIKKCTSKKLNIKDEDIHNLKIIKPFLLTFLFNEHYKHDNCSFIKFFFNCIITRNF